MISEHQTRLDSKTLVARDPDRAAKLAPNSKPQPDGTLVKALARVW